MADDELLRAPHVLEFPYVRSTGPVVGAFFTGLRDGRLVGVRSPAEGGRVVVPPTEYDPVTGQDTGEIVDVGPGGEVTTWAWAGSPRPDQPFDRPFAWALIRLDGADTALLHAVDTGGHPDAMSTGMRVTARFRSEGEREGTWHDLDGFVPEGSASERPAGEASAPEGSAR
jgi:uncharacterized protein